MFSKSLLGSVDRCGILPGVARFCLGAPWERQVLRLREAPRDPDSVVPVKQNRTISPRAKIWTVLEICVWWGGWLGQSVLGSGFRVRGPEAEDPNQKT